MSAPASLTERELAMLTFEKQQWRHAGTRDAAIRDLFDVTPTRYHQLLLVLIDRPQALAAEPVVVNRLRRRRDDAMRRRGTLRLGV